MTANFNYIKCPKCEHDRNPSTAIKCEICGASLRKTKSPVVAIGAGLMTLGILGAAVYFLRDATPGLDPSPLEPLQSSVSSSNVKPSASSTSASSISASSQPLEAKSLRIGILGAQKYYKPLVDYLHGQFGEQIQIVLDGSEEISYPDAKSKISKRDWDIAFTLSPMLSVAAKDNGYTFIARMFPKFEPYYESALFVRQESPIQSLEDLKPTTRLAMGDFNSASSFYMPVYDLFGKTLRIDMGHRGSDIQKMVKDGRADVGAGALSFIQDKPEFRVIHVSRKIPGAGVYFSPSLSASDRTVIQNVLLGAPQEIRDGANYGKGQEVDYTSFVGISRKVEKLLACANFSNSVVPLFCGTSEKLSTLPVGQEEQTIIGRINGFSYSSADRLTLNLSGQDGRTYQVVMPRTFLNTIPDAPPPPGLNGKTVQIIGVTPTSKNNVLKLQVTKAEQFRVVQNP